MQGLSELRKLLGAKSPSNGEVVSVLEGKVRVATKLGVQELPNASGIALSAGDLVTLYEGAITGRISDKTTLPVYFV